MDLRRDSASFALYAGALDFVIETAVVIGGWWYFKGDWKLLVALLFLSLTNLPMMFSDGNGRALANNHLILPTIILVQTVVTIALVWLFGRQRSAALTIGAEMGAGTRDTAVA